MHPVNLLPIIGVPTGRTRLVARSRQRCARVRHNRCGRALLGRHRLAERRIGDGFRRNRGCVAFAEGRSGFRWLYRVRDRHRHAVICAALIKFAVLPGLDTFPAFCLALGLFFIPIGFGVALARQPAMSAVFTAMAFNFMPLLSPTNQMNYNTVQFYNAALAIVAGCSVAPLAFRLLPLLSPAVRARRLLALTLRDLRRLATAPLLPRLQDWEGRMYGRLVALPDQAEPLQRARLLAALSVGTEIIHLRQMVPRLGAAAELRCRARSHRAGKQRDSQWRGYVSSIVASLPVPDPGQETAIAVRARSRILVISEALAEHSSYFDAGAPT